MHLSPPFCAPLAKGTKILTHEIWVRPTYACKILSGSVKVCRRPIFSRYIPCCYAYLTDFTLRALIHTCPCRQRHCTKCNIDAFMSPKRYGWELQQVHIHCVEIPVQLHVHFNLLGPLFSRSSCSAICVPKNFNTWLKIGRPMTEFSSSTAQLHNTDAYLLVIRNTLRTGGVIVL